MPSIKDIHVKMEGIIEVRQLSDNVDFEVPEPEDFYHFQQKYEEVPDNFCKQFSIVLSATVTVKTLKV